MEGDFGDNPEREDYCDITRGLSHEGEALQRLTSKKGATEQVTEAKG